MNQPPLILAIGGHDPTGGAGIQADIETIAALGGRALTLVTALTAQDTRDVAAVMPNPADAFQRQLDTLLADIRPDAIKIGLVGTTAIVSVLAPLLAGFTGPVVLDPVLAAGGGTDLATMELVQAMRERLLPQATLMTPNSAEARRLAGVDDARQAAAALLATGVGAVLLTAADEARSDNVVNTLYLADGTSRACAWPRLPHRYHGSGCTLASACATCLALGDPLPAAVQAAQAFTWRALEHATITGHGQRLPVRLR